MNGYALANAFRTLRESWRFTSTEADLYYELVGIANERGWPTGFQYSNQLLCATIGISEKSLIAARNRLKQAGLLDFVSGHKRAPTAYTLSQKGLPQVSKSGSKKGSVSDSESDSPFIKELKQKGNELQKKIEEERAASAAARLELENRLAEMGRQLERLASTPKEVSAPPVAAAPPPKVPRLKASRGGKQLLSESPVADFAAFVAAWNEAAAANPATYAPFAGVDLRHYHTALGDWSAGNGEKKVDWLATIRGSIRRDNDAGTLRKVGTPPTQQSRHAAPSPQQPATRYNTTARGGFGGFANAPAGRHQPAQSVAGNEPGHAIGGTAHPAPGVAPGQNHQP